MTDEIVGRFKDALNALLAQSGRGRLVALGLACATFVLPLYEIRVPTDGRVRRALRCTRQTTDWLPARTAAAEAFFSSGTPSEMIAGHAAAAAAAAARTATLCTQPGRMKDAVVVWDLLRCIESGMQALRLTEANGSAQERLDLLGRMEGHSSFEALLAAWIAEPDPLWRDRLATRTLEAL